MRNKIVDLNSAINLISDGDSIMISGFLGVGNPNILIDAIVKKGIKNLSIIANDTAKPGIGISNLIAAGLVKTVIASHVGTNPKTGELMSTGELNVDLVPQGTLIERIRAGGFGLGGVLTPTGIGTEIANGKQIITVDGKDYLLEKPLRAKIGLIKGAKVDKSGNIYYLGTTRNFAPLIAAACNIVIVEAQELVEIGDIAPEDVMTPNIFVDYIVKGGKQ